jgi:hypothetical protein
LHVPLLFARAVCPSEVVVEDVCASGGLEQILASQRPCQLPKQSHRRESTLKTFCRVLQAFAECRNWEVQLLGSRPNIHTDAQAVLAIEPAQEEGQPLTEFSKVSALVSMCTM